MGSYLIVDGKENNTKSISYPMIDLMRDILPEKNSLSGEDAFALTTREMATLLYNTTQLLKDDELLESYMEKHRECYDVKDATIEDVKDTISYIHRLFAEVLSEMVYDDKRTIVCEWSG